VTLPSANLVYPLALEGFIRKQIDVASPPLALYALKSTYSYSATHQHVADLGSSIIAGPVNLTSPTESGGGLYCTNPVTFVTPSGGPITALVVAQNTSTPSTDLLIALLVRNADTTPINEPTPGAVNLIYTFPGTGLILQV